MRGGDDETDRSDADNLHNRNGRADRDDDLLQQEVEMDDLISRQAALDALDQIFDRCEEIEAHLPEGDPDRTGYKMYPDYMTVWKYLHQLPSAQPEIIRCKDCKYQKKFFHEDKRRKEGGYYLFGCDLTDGYSHVCLDDDYCSRAERRTDE